MTVIQRHLLHNHIIGPDEISKLQSVFDEICQRRKIDPGGEEAAGLARRIFALFQTGIHDPNKLRAMLDET
ncbi:hypothetical protein J2Y48_002316 [Mycoplana sp. BE70]|uniref:hypothetical protein n=1 Tax=Mycoplana sp. BE70 TaxID=2817775 RepID=UPI00286629C4|nr:hypothetical protein [Mycoplana sp. BE70]MDR6757020.1 hypothetical protein [Mycoplana sp. BE70]